MFKKKRKENLAGVPSHDFTTVIAQKYLKKKKVSLILLLKEI